MKDFGWARPTEDGDFRLKNPGTYVLVLQTDDRAQTHLPSIRFNDYLKVEGLTPALEQRARLHRMDADGSERYSRCAKSIVQVGPSGAGSQDQVSKPVGLPLEIVPEANPYAVPRSATLPVRVIYAGRPLAGALVKLTDLKNDASPLEMHLTDHDGRATFTMPSSGTWLLNVIWTKALPRSDEDGLRNSLLQSELRLSVRRRERPRLRKVDGTFERRIRRANRRIARLRNGSLAAYRIVSGCGLPRPPTGQPSVKERGELGPWTA